MADSVNPYLDARRSRGNPNSDPSQRLARATLFGEAMVSPVGEARANLADEGSYFVATNPTPGTGVAGISAADGLDDLEALIQIRNTVAASSKKRVYLDYIRLQATAAGTNGTDFAYAMKLDSGSDRYASGGSLITPVNPNMDDTSSPDATCRFGALVPTAAGTLARLVSHGLLRPVIKVIGDTYLFVFGRGSQALGAQPVAGTAVANVVVQCPPVVLGSNQEFYLHEFATAQTVAASYEFEIGWWER